MSITTADLRAMGRDANGKPLPHAEPRKACGTGEHAVRKQRALNGGMNGWEKAFADMLEMQRVTGYVKWWKYEGIKLRLADGAWFKVDFFVMYADGTTEAVEVKGHMREAARVRLRVAADLYPWKFSIARKTKDGWSYEIVPGKFFLANRTK
jgi:hypothetical protein